jgi:malate/lactate dehydrogenase
MIPAPQNPLITELSLYDIAGTPGVATDISHINTKAQVKVRHPFPRPHTHLIVLGLPERGSGFYSGF